MSEYCEAFEKRCLLRTDTGDRSWLEEKLLVRRRRCSRYEGECTGDPVSMGDIVRELRSGVDGGEFEGSMVAVGCCGECCEVRMARV